MENSGLDALRAAAIAVRMPEASSLDDRRLLDTQRLLAEVRRLVDAAAAPLAAETARRSRRELGYGGLAQRLGMRTAEALVQRVSGATARDARALVTVGALVSDSASPVGEAVREGRISVAAAAAITAGLGHETESVSAGTLSDAGVVLVAEAPGRTVEQLAARARELRDELDEDGVPGRAAELRARRFLRLIPQDDGMTRLFGLLDPESAARVKSVVDAATSPRRGGPRFTAPADVARANAVIDDPRSTDQLALDAVVDLLEVGGAVDPHEVLAVAPAPLQVLVTAKDLVGGRGVARIEGQSSAVAVETARRVACSSGISPIRFDPDGPIINLGRTRRLFNRAQRRAMGARDGGCRVPGCDRPPSWCEAHHIVEWSRNGRTDLADGILLCRHHHLLVHDNGWRIERDGADYFLIPPEPEDPLRRRIPMPTKNPLARRLAG